VRDPRWLVPLAAERHRGQVRGVRFDEKAVSGHEPQQIIVRPFPEGDDSAEGDVPPGSERVGRERVRSGIAVEYSGDARLPRLIDDGSRVVFCFTRVHDERTPDLGSQRYLRGKGGELHRAGRVVVVVVQPAFSDGNRARFEVRPERGDIAFRVEAHGVVGVNSGGREDEPGICGG